MSFWNDPLKAIADRLMGILYDSYGYLLMPHPKKNLILAGRALEVYFDAVKDVSVAIDREVTTELVQIKMGRTKGLKSDLVRYFSYRQQRKMIDNIITWLEAHDKAKDTITLLGAPYILYAVMEKLKAQGKSFNFGERGAVATGGGWKGLRNITSSEFRKEVNKVLGISERLVLDVYEHGGGEWMDDSLSGGSLSPCPVHVL